MSWNPHCAYKLSGAYMHLSLLSRVGERRADAGHLTIWSISFLVPYPKTKQNQSNQVKFVTYFQSGLEIIFGHSPVKMTGQLHFHSVIPRFWPNKYNTVTYFFFYKAHLAIRRIPNFATQVFKLKNITKICGHRTRPELKKKFSQVYFNHNWICL